MPTRPALLAAMLLLAPALSACAEDSPEHVGIGDKIDSLVTTYCLDCHNSADRAAGFDLESISEEGVIDHSEDWEKVVTKLRARQMPPSEADRPEEAEVVAALELLERTLDAHAKASPQVGRTDAFRRLTRYEYGNAIRDLLALEVDVQALLPADEVSHGFDNITVGELSPALLARYVSAAQKISRLAVGRSGRSGRSPGGATYRVKPDVTQESHVEGLPIGTRGGTLIRHTFPENGQYEISIRLTRDRNEHVEGLHEPHELELLIDSERVKQFTVKPPRGKQPAAEGWEKPTHDNVDRHLKIRTKVTAGPHQVGVTFLKKPTSLLETRRQPLNVHYNMYRHPRIGPAIFQVSITGPYEADGPGETPSRERIFVRRPQGADDEQACAEEIIQRLVRRASRRPVGPHAMAKPMALYQQARDEGEGFEAGIEAALSFILISPEFLFRIERDRPDVPPATAYRLSDLELASRLSFFLWSSIPDDELLALAEQGRLSDPDVLAQQTSRMLADDRSRALVDSFAGQWLYLRNLESMAPDARLFPDFDDNLRQAFRRETELFFESIVREDRSVIDLIAADYTYLNERLAKHYGIPHVYGSRFRRVQLDPESRRGGLLRHGSILSVTSYATRTSPVIRGKWILENLIGTPPPPPPPNVPALTENNVSARLPVRQRLAQHRADPACASCHNLIDPVGFALEHFDAVGRWRQMEEGRPVDAAGGLPDGSRFDGVGGLEQGLIDRPQLLVATMAEKLLTYATGRGTEHYDGPAIRQIIRDAEQNNYRFSSLIQAIVRSRPFQMRMSPSSPGSASSPET